MHFSIPFFVSPPQGAEKSKPVWSESRHPSIRCWLGGLQAAETSPALALLEICRRQSPSQRERAVPRGWRNRKQSRRQRAASETCERTLKYCVTSVFFWRGEPRGYHLFLNASATDVVDTVLSQRMMHVHVMNVQKNFSLSCNPRKKNAEDVARSG